MSAKKRISVIIPVYNEAAFLPTCLKAVLAQTLPADEIIVVDNNSTDKSVDIALKHKSVTVITEQQQGVMFARAAGLNAANGDLLLTIDADTRVKANWIEYILENYEQRGWAGWSGFIDSYDIPDKTALERVLRATALRIYNWYVFGLNWILSGGYRMMLGVNMVITKSAWVTIKDTARIQANVWEDFEIAMALQDVGLTVVNDKHVVAGISSRSAYDSLSHNWHRLKLWSITFRTHSRLASVLSFVFSCILMLLLALMQLLIPKRKS